MAMGSAKFSRCGQYGCFMGGIALMVPETVGCSSRVYHNAAHEMCRLTPWMVCGGGGRPAGFHRGLRCGYFPPRVVVQICFHISVGIRLCGHLALGVVRGVGCRGVRSAVGRGGTALNDQ